MATDPICGMVVEEQGARHVIHDEHEAIYFCSNQCKEIYTRNASAKTEFRKKGFLLKFLEKLASDNNQTFGGTPPRCH